MEQDLLYKNEVYKIIGAAIDVHKELGSGFLESVYEEAMCYESDLLEIPYETQVQIHVHYKNTILKKHFTADYIGFGKIIVEFKCIPNTYKDRGSTDYKLFESHKFKSRSSH